MAYPLPLDMAYSTFLSNTALRKEKEEAQQRKFLDSLKQLQINLPFIEDLAQMPNYAHFLKDQSIKRPPNEYDIETLKLLENDRFDLFLLKGLEKLIDQSDLESCESLENKSNYESDLGIPIGRINYVNMPYYVEQRTTRPNGVKTEHLYLASTNEIDENRPEQESLPNHLEYAYLQSDKSFPIIISSKLFENEKKLLLHVLEKRKGAIAWKMSDIKGISLSFCTHKILIEDDFKLVIQPQRRLNPKVQDC
ncbi:hypothetical protein Tco_1387448 [Tanacetum coccineum]